ncbi:hypothetical protein PC128_g24361 [Phytophthora cactorum]|nr:hypothetical protein PC128_g24361 [Phytophthora cactorum]
MDDEFKRRFQCLEKKVAAATISKPSNNLTVVYLF